MLDRESACNRVFQARRFASVRACSFVFKLAAAPRSTMSLPLPYCRTNQTGSDVDVIGMITASARHRWTYRRRNGTKRNSSMISRARARGCAQGGAGSESVPARQGIEPYAPARARPVFLFWPRGGHVAFWPRRSSVVTTTTSLRLRALIRCRQ